MATVETATVLSVAAVAVQVETPLTIQAILRTESADLGLPAVSPALPSLTAEAAEGVVLPPVVALAVLVEVVMAVHTTRRQDRMEPMDSAVVAEVVRPLTTLMVEMVEMVL